MSPLQTDKMSVPVASSPVIDSVKQEILQDSQQAQVEKARQDNVRQSIESLPAQEMSEEELERLLAVKKAERIKLKQHLVSVLERGAVASRLDVPLPKGVYGEWVRNEPLEIDRLRKLGFDLDRKYAVDRSLHDDGTGDVAQIGDVVFMTCKQEVKDIIDEIRAEQSKEKHSPKKKQAEEKNFIAQIQRDSGGVVPTVTDSNVRTAMKEDIKNALDTLNQP